MLKHPFQQFRSAFFGLIGLATVCTAASTAEARSSSDRVCRFTSSVTDSSQLKGCTDVIGDVRLEHSQAETLTNLSALRRVTGSLVIAENPKLTSLEGLSNLRSVGSLVVTHNPTLESVSDLDSLEQVSRLEVSNNPELSVLWGPDAVEQVGELVVVENGLVRIAGFRHLARARKVVVAKNPKLIYTTGLSRLVTVDKLELTSNPRMAPVSRFFGNLVKVGELSVTHCPGIRPEDLRQNG